MATIASVTMTLTRISPADFRQRQSVLPPGSTTKTLISAMASHPSSPATVAAGTAYADTDVVTLELTGTQADLKALAL